MGQFTSGADLRRGRGRGRLARRKRAAVALERLEPRTLLAVGLVASYGFEEGSGASVYDVSGNGHTGTLSNVSRTTAGRFGSALTFNGTSSRVTIPDSDLLDLTNGMTLEAWVRPSTSSGSRSVIFKPSSNGLMYGLYANNSSSRPGGYINVGGTNRLAQGSSQLPVNTWSHLAATFNGSVLRLYVNGTQVGSTNISGTMLATTEALTIGSNAIWGDYFSGRIDEVRIYDRALSASEIQTDMNTAVGSDTTAPTLLARSPLNNATGVPVAANVTATFSEAIQPGTISFTLRNPANTAIAASLMYDPVTRTATLDPNVDLASNTRYTVTLSGVKDIVGNTMATQTWAFTTVTSSDTTPPTVTSRSPAPGAIGVDVATNVTATFSEAVQESTIIMTLTDPSGGAVAANVSYNASTRVVTFDPTVDLGYATTYTASLSGARDLAGNLMTPLTWTFTTAADANSTGDPTLKAPSLGAPPAASSSVIWVSTTTALQNAVANLVSGQTIVIRKGTYNLTNTLYIGLNSKVTNVTIRGETDDFRDVVLLGRGMENSSFGSVPMGISVYNAQNVTIANLSIGEVYYHPIELKAESGAAQIQIYHVRLFNAGEQFIKASPTPSGTGLKNATVEYSLIEYTQGPPTTDHGGGVGYTNGLSVHAGENWVIRNNLFRNFHTPDSVPATNQWNPVVLMWNHSVGTIVEGNTFIDSDRAIAFGLYDNTGFDHQGGVIRNNYIYQSPGLFSSSRRSASDAQIIVWDSPGTVVEHNTILTNGNSLRSIEVRFSSTTGIAIRNNLADAPLSARNSASYSASGNYLSATSAMFVDAATGNMHLVWNSATHANVIDKVNGSATSPTDWDGDARPTSAGADVGADEFRAIPNSDTTPPALTAWTPATGATDVSIGSNVTATFSEAVVAGSIEVVLRNAANTAVASSVTYDAASRTVTLDPTADLAYLSVYTVTVSGARDLAGNVMAPVSWTFTTVAAPDTTPPTVTARTPADGATSVSINTNVTATFSEAVQASTISFVLRNSAQTTIAASVSYDATTRVVTLDPTLDLAWATTYTATLSGAKDLAGNTMAPITWSFTTAAAVAYTIWSSTTTPSVTAATDTAAVEVGVKFRSDSDGVISGIRFYKGTGNTGTHVGRVWSSTGTLLASATFTNETSSGWQQVNFATPLAITANTTYVVSYHAPNGRYAINQSYFASSGVTNGPLTALSNSEASGNGVYRYGSGGVFPNQTWNASNYWVDVVFTPGADTTPPTVTSRSPAIGASDVALDANVLATFSEDVQPSTISVVLKDPANVTVGAQVTYDAASRTVTLDPTANLAYSTTYTATISGAKDMAGNLMTTLWWSFTTVAPDTTPPTVVARSPVPGASSVVTSTNVTATFSEPVQASTINFVLRNPSNVTVQATVSYDAASRTVTLDPNVNLATMTTYTATLSGAKDLAGNTMATVTWSFTTGNGQGLANLPLLTQNNVEYVGAFRVPSGTFGASSFEYGGTAITFNAANNSLFIVGQDQHQAIAEIKIPSNIVNSANLNNLSTATVLQPFSRVFNRVPNWSLDSEAKIGGLMVVDGKLVGTAYEYYDGNSNAVDSHFVLSSLNLATASISGLHQVGTLGGGFVGGYMAAIPSEWQSTLGAAYLTGQAAIPIVSRTSLGPAAFGFDPNALGQGVTPVKPYVYYPMSNPTLGAWNSDWPTLFNSNAQITGVAFAPGTRSVLFFGSVGTNKFYYGEASDANDPYRVYKGTHSVNGDYSYFVWAYDALDLTDVKNGVKAPYAITPYATWQFDVPQFNGAKYTGGVAFDAANGLIYLAQSGADTNSKPLIQVFRIKTS